MTHPIGYSTSYNPQTQKPDILHSLQEGYGAQFQQMTYEQKIVFRAALAGYIAEKPVWQQEGNSITCIDCCIESAGVDWDIWDKDPELVEIILECSRLDESDIEGLIEAISAQIRGRVYASRIEEWEVISP